MCVQGRQVLEDSYEEIVPEDDDWVESVSRESSAIHPDVTEEWKPVVWLLESFSVKYLLGCSLFLVVNH